MTVFYMYFYFFKTKTLANIYFEIIKVNPRFKVMIRYLLKRL